MSKANTAKTETEKAGAKEKVQMAVMSSFDNSGKLDYTQLKTNLDKVEGIDKETVPSPTTQKMAAMQEKLNSFAAEVIR